MKSAPVEILPFRAGRRSRKGAWIEIHRYADALLYRIGRSREGAWIEISWGRTRKNPHYRRSREGVWIEMSLLLIRPAADVVAPVRERGFKYRFLRRINDVRRVAPARERGLKCRSMQQ